MKTTRPSRYVRAHEAAEITAFEKNETIPAATVHSSNQRLRRLKTSLRRGRHSARVQSAVALSGNLKARVRADLIRLYGPLKVSFVEIPALSGGMRITVGSDLYYGSVRSTLAALEGKLQH